MNDMAVANTILSQLGGRRFIAMTGAHSFSGGDDRLTFKLPRAAKSGINAVMIRLEPSDTYAVTFFDTRRATSYESMILETVNDVYCDNLADVIAHHTGLAVTL